MRRTILLAAAVSLILLGFLISWDLSGISDVEFAKALMEESADSTGLYSAPSKSALPDDDGLSWDIVSYFEDPVRTHNWEITFTFTDYTPPFAPNSIVNGTLTTEITFDTDAQTVIVTFNGSLIVTGEHEGDYIYTAQLIIYLDTGQYDYSGKITIGGAVHDVTK